MGVKVEQAGGVRRIILARPEKKNALTGAMYQALAEGLEAGAADPQTRAILIGAEGADFCAGNDIQDFAAMAFSGGDFREAPVMRFLKALARAEKPIVAAARGRAVGVGTTLLLHCDLVYVAEDATLSTPFVNLALTPEAASSLLMPRVLGHQRAYAMFALGESLGGAEAARLGLANAAAPSAALDDLVEAALAKLVAQPLGALTASKRLMRDAEAIAGLMEREAEIFAARLRSPEAAEAFAAFAQKRAPDFRNLG